MEITHIALILPDRTLLELPLENAKAVRGKLNSVFEDLDMGDAPLFPIPDSIPLVVDPEKLPPKWKVCDGTLIIR